MRTVREIYRTIDDIDILTNWLDNLSVNPDLSDKDTDMYRHVIQMLSGYRDELLDKKVQ